MHRTKLATALLIAAFALGVGATAETASADSVRLAPVTADIATTGTTPTTSSSDLQTGSATLAQAASASVPGYSAPYWALLIGCGLTSGHVNTGADVPGGNNNLCTYL